MSSPSPIPPPNDRRSSRASSIADMMGSGMLSPEQASYPVLIGGPPSDPSPLALRAENSPSSRRRKAFGKVPPEFQSLEYVSTPDSNLVCLICHTPFDKPVQLPCEHCFCHECLEHAWAPRTNGQKTCPTCRRHVQSVNELRPLPKIIKTILDELVVKCPNAKAGCDWADCRINVDDHVVLYCEYTPVHCSSDDCRLPVSQKDFHKGCLHYTVTCEHCHASLMKKDLEEHQRKSCTHRMTACTLCSAEMLRLDLKAHVSNDCPMHIMSCQGTIVGCTFAAERKHVVLHEAQCTMATMAPYFREQQARIERNEAKMEPLSRKVGILEDGFSSITNLLYPANSNDQSYPIADPLDPNNASSHTSVPEYRLPNTPFTALPSGSEHNSVPSAFDSQVHHLLTLHDSLRDEVARIANALTDLDGRTNLMIMNESQRAKDEMLHTNAAISSLRVHLQWLVSATIQQRTTSVRSSTANTAGSTSINMGSSTVRPVELRHRSMQGSRRLSEDTKL